MEIKTEKGNFIMIEIPSDATDFKINSAGCIRYFNKRGLENSPILPEQLGVWASEDLIQIIGSTNLITQEEAESFLRYSLFAETKFYFNYLPFKSSDFRDLIENSFTDYKESLKSLLESFNLNPSKNFLIIKKLN
jgi:hypothetical protein